MACCEEYRTTSPHPPTQAEAKQLSMEMGKWYCVELSGHADERLCQVYRFMLGGWLKAGSF